MPNLLFIDTSGKTATVALSTGYRPVVVRRITDAREQAAALNLVIGEVMDAGERTLRDLDAIAVCAGPGSYTGLRVGMSTAKGLAYALEKPLMLFNQLDLLAAQYKEDGALMIALKARAGEYFFARYHSGGGAAEAPAHRFALEIDAPEAALLLTDDPELFPHSHRLLLNMEEGADMLSWIAQAATRFANSDFDDLAYSEPFYLKAAYTTQSKK